MSNTLPNQQLNAFTQHGLTHLSPSSINLYVGDPSKWVAEKILGHRGPPGAAMARGSAIETGVVAVLMGDSIEDGTAKALAEFDKQAMFTGITGDCDKERLTIAPSIEIAVDALAGHGKPRFTDDGRQQKISINCRYGEAEQDVITLIGYLDLVYPERKLIVDLKTTGRMPSEMSFAHQLQRAVYMRATGLDCDFLYVTPKKAEFRSDGDVDEILAQIKVIVGRMARFLALGDKETLRQVVPVSTDGFYWKGEEAKRRELFGL